MRKEAHRCIDDQQMFLLKVDRMVAAKHLFTQTTVFARLSLYPKFDERFTRNATHDTALRSRRYSCEIVPSIYIISRMFVYNAKCGCSSIWVLINEQNVRFFRFNFFFLLSTSYSDNNKKMRLNRTCATFQFKRHEKKEK